MIKPKRLMPGDKVAVISPASPCSREELEIGIKALESLDLKVLPPTEATSPLPYLAASDETRVEAFHQALADKDVKAIFCARGGYGSMRLVEKIKPDLILQNPKIFVGYSDLTTWLTLFTMSYNWVSFHGPVVVKDLDPQKSQHTLASLKRALMDTEPLGILDPRQFGSPQPKTLRPGKARGILVGGNLTLLCATLGTKHEIQTDGKILLLEDRGERPYRIDRMLWHLKLAKKFSKVAGIVLSDFLDCTETGDLQELLRVFQDVFSDIEAPIFFGFPAGHSQEKLTLPLGVLAAIDADQGILQILESGVA